MARVTLLSHDVWKDCAALLSLMPATLHPAQEDADKWMMKVQINDKWIEKDPLMLQMMHDKVKTIRLLLTHEVGMLIDTYWNDISSGTNHEIMSGQMEILSNIANIKIKEGSRLASEGCGEIYQRHLKSVQSYKEYRIKEGVGFAYKGINTVLSTGITLSGISASMTGVGIVGAVVGLSATVGNILQLATQMIDWCLEAEALQKEIDVKMKLLKARYGNKITGNKVAVALQEGVEKYAWSTIGLGLDRNFSITVSAVSELVDKYNSKINGLDKGAHEMAKLLDKLLVVTVDMRRQLEDDRANTDQMIQRIRANKPVSLVGHLNKLFAEMSKKKSSKPPKTSDFVKNQILTNQSRKIAIQEVKVEKAIDNTISLRMRVEKGRNIYKDYNDVFDGFIGSKALKNVQLASKVATFLTWQLPQTVAFSDYGKILAKDAGEIAHHIYGLVDTGISSGVEFGMEFSERATS